jgi:hypothetical protein
VNCTQCGMIPSRTDLFPYAELTKANAVTAVIDNAFIGLPHAAQVIVDKQVQSGRRHSLESRPCTPLGTQVASVTGSGAGGPASRGRRTRRSSVGSEVEPAPRPHSGSRSRSRSGSASRSITRVHVSDKRVAQNTSRTPLSLVVAANAAASYNTKSGECSGEVLKNVIGSVLPDKRGLEC